MKISTSQFKTSFIWLLVSILFSFSIAFLGSFDRSLKLIIGSALYFFASWIILKVNLSISRIIRVAIVLFPIIFFQLSANILHFENTINSLPVHLFLLLSALFGCLFYYKKKLWIPASLAVLMAFYMIKGMEWYNNYRYFGEINNSPRSNLPAYKLFNSDSSVATFNENKIVILDFWNSKCGPCFRSFPHIDSVIKKIDTSKFEFAVVNVPFIGESITKNASILNKLNYHFRQVFAQDQQILSTFQITHYPTTIAFDKNTLLFRGEFDDVLLKSNALRSPISK